jgi:hypothetical protein
MYGIIPQIGFKEFLDKLDKETNSSIKWAMIVLNRLRGSSPASSIFLDRLHN